MTVLPPALLADVADALRAAGRQDLVDRLAALEAKPVLTSAEAARVLGLSSPSTVKNWLAGGFFPGATRTAGGHWRFPRAEVEAVQRRIAELRARNRLGELTPPDTGDEGPPPLL